MNTIRYTVLNVLCTILRMFPVPSRTGLIRIGNPGRDAPVLLTCNYLLTVERVKREIGGLDAYLLVANSRGINVWCAACGGHLTNHDVISALKTTGVEELVDHRSVILPQLSAPGIESSVIKKKAGWRVVWGPVRAADIPEFLKNGLTKGADVRTVDFPFSDRLEMATAWAAPMSAFAAVFCLLFWREALAPLVAMIWALCLLVFLSFPLYGGLMGTGGRRAAGVTLDFAGGGLPLILWGLCVLGLVVYAAASGEWSWPFMYRWGLASLVVVIILTVDLAGSTPVFKSGLQEERLFAVAVDTNRCRGAGFCNDVCPRDCFEVDRARKTARMPRAGRCVRCGACIVQCPFDALRFESPDGRVVDPGTLRRYKLNLMGKRSVTG